AAPQFCCSNVPPSGGSGLIVSRQTQESRPGWAAFSVQVRSVRVGSEPDDGAGHYRLEVFEVELLLRLRDRLSIHHFVSKGRYSHDPIGTEYGVGIARVVAEPEIEVHGCGVDLLHDAEP